VKLFGWIIPFSFYVASCFAQAPLDTSLLPPFGWVPNSTVGVVGGIPPRTNTQIFYASRPPYSADKTGRTNCQDIINQALVDAGAWAATNTAAGAVVQLDDGIYLTSGQIGSLDYVTLRGEHYGLVTNVNTTSQMLALQAAINTDTEQTPVYGTIPAGGTNLSTIGNMVDAVVGEIISIKPANITNEVFNTISTVGFNYVMAQQVCVTAKSATNITFWPPTVFSYTNAVVTLLSFGNQAGLYRPRKWAGVENIIFTATNSVTSSQNGSTFQAIMGNAVNCWVKGCSFLYGNNYPFNQNTCVSCYFGGNIIRGRAGAGLTSNHAGFLWQLSSGCLVENNAILDGLFPAMETWSGAGNAWIYNMSTNNPREISIHNTHPFQFLVEGNYNQTHLSADGYYGSASHWAIFRNVFGDGFVPIYLKRFNTYFQIVGNLLGDTNFTYSAFTTDAPGSIAQIIEKGRPNIGNETFFGTNPPVAFNYPGTNYDGLTPGHGFYTFTSNQTSTTNLLGDFSWVGNDVTYGFAGTVRSLWIQSGSNTNSYFMGDNTNATLLAMAPGTSTNLFVNTPVTVHTGDTLYIGGPVGFQQLQTQNRSTYTINGNWDAYNHAQTFDGTHSSNLWASLIYSNSPPAWYWRTNHSNTNLYVSQWPPIQPESTSKHQGLIPAQIWYYEGSNPFTVEGTCNYSIDSTSATADASGIVLSGSTTINVTVGGSCSWTAGANDSWLHISSGSSGSGNGVVTYTVDANAGSLRSGTLTVAGYTFTVTQNAAVVSTSASRHRASARRRY
jgi:hypothetical protein